ncbi:MAG: acyl-ACP--UDP-N-acetylglucosamine O-acyltransferase [Nitrospina sp.]|nr:acyl-ACP--UDP-N-acetylglucosamine O-acyltransferase [Nitrospina sp.]MBT6601780.1 acyl-ACP--UDP-N-acetylglucosamine O-acyltransferase [Nitrospina sp.]
MTIHSNSEIDSSVDLGKDIRVGPFSTIGSGVKIGDRTEIGPNVHIESGTVVGEDCRIFHGASIGGDPQITGVRDITSSVEIGDKTTVREFVTIHRSANEGEKTIIGNGCLLMAYAHIAHDCVIGNDVVIVNATSLSGHIIVEERAFISGMIGVHQFVRFGKLSMTGGMSRIVKDIIPFSTVEGSPARLIGTNAIGLKRAGVAPAIRSGLKKAIGFIMHRELNTTQAIKKIEEEIEISDEIRYLINFVNQSDRGIIR